MDLRTSITANINPRNPSPLSANKPRLLSNEKPHTIQPVPGSGNELDGVHRRCMQNAHNRQGKHLLSTTPTQKQIGSCALPMGTNMRSRSTRCRHLRVQQRTTHWPNENQRSTPKKEGTALSNPLDKVLPRRLLDPQGGQNKKSLLPQETDTGGKESERMGKGREEAPLGEGERKNPARHGSLATTNPNVVGGT